MNAPQISTEDLSYRKHVQLAGTRMAYVDVGEGDPPRKESVYRVPPATPEHPGADARGLSALLGHSRSGAHAHACLVPGPANSGGTS